jgi:hypothetical protein
MADLGEFILPYGRCALSPDDTLLAFLRATYEARRRWHSGIARHSSARRSKAWSG